MIGVCFVFACGFVVVMISLEVLVVLLLYAGVLI